MSRPIKFRAWDKKEKQMYYEPKCDLGSWTLDELRDKKIFSLMQFTGLKDCRGREIYEGDIVKRGTTITDIVWENTGFKLRKGNLVSDVVKPIEVVGNIYENGDLLCSGSSQA